MIDIPDEENAMGYYKIRQQLQKLSEELLQFIHQPKYLLPYLQPGRLVHVSECAFTFLRPFFFVFSFVSILKCSSDIQLKNALQCFSS